MDKAFSSKPSGEKDILLKGLLEEAAMVIDRSECAGLSIVSVVTYPPAARRGKSDDADLSYSVKEYRGDILPHDELMILYDENNWTVFKEVDLAVVILKKPIEGVSHTVKMAKSEVQIDDIIVMVGYGLGDDDENAKLYGDRNFGEGQVVKVATSESGNVQFLTGRKARDGGEASSVYGGDSGAPGFRRKNGTELVGIASASAEDEEGNRFSIFTSIYPHREWLKKVVTDAEATAR